MTELRLFFDLWEKEADRTLQLFHALPVEQYDLRPDNGGRSLGELAWHLAEVDAYMSLAVANSGHRESVRPPKIERPRTIPELPASYTVVHAEAVERLRMLTQADLEREVSIFGEPLPIRVVLWDLIISHAAHHRGQLSLMCRLAGGTPPELYGPTRETMQAVRTRLSAARDNADL